MSRSIAGRAALAAVGILAASNGAIGAITGVTIHLRAVAARDEALAAAAHARARPEGPGGWSVYHDPPDVTAWIVAPGDDRVPERLHARVVRDGEPILKDLGDERLLLIPAEIPDPRRVVAVAAVAPRVTLRNSVGAFAAVWLASSAAVTAIGAWGLSAVVRRSLQPLDAARRDVVRVVALGQGQRVSAEVPAEVRPLVDAVNELLDRLDGAHTLQARFTAEAAHELRTPVAALLSQLDVALLEQADDGLVRSLHEDVERLRGVVEALTALARVDTGDIDAHRDLVRARDVAEGAARAERRVLDDAGCRVRVHVDDDPELEVHQALLELALGNLLRNAARHAPGAEVTLTVRADAELVRFEVRDTGPGIDPALAEAAFVRFVRGPRARVADPGGLGLGLPLAREVARRHGGDCTLRGVSSGGTVATLTARRP